MTARLALLFSLVLLGMGACEPVPVEPVTPLQRCFSGDGAEIPCDDGDWYLQR